MYEEKSYRHLTYIKTMLNVLITAVKVVYGLNTLCESLKFNEDTWHDRYSSHHFIKFRLSLIINLIQIITYSDPDY